MKYLWIYGCSFSEPFGIETGGPGFDRNGHRIFREKFWGTHLADMLNFSLKCKSISGVGWNYINDKIDEDFGNWNKDDIIIISPSFFSRITWEETVKKDLRSEIPHLIKDVDYIIQYNSTRWKNKICSLQKLGFQVYTWINELAPDVSSVKNLITFDNIVNFKDWMDLHKEFWTDPTNSKYPNGDWHPNSAGHVEIARQMFHSIKL